MKNRKRKRKRNEKKKHTQHNTKKVEFAQQAKRNDRKGKTKREKIVDVISPNREKAEVKKKKRKKRGTQKKKILVPQKRNEIEFPTKKTRIPIRVPGQSFSLTCKYSLTGVRFFSSLSLSLSLPLRRTSLSVFFFVFDSLKLCSVVFHALLLVPETETPVLFSCNSKLFCKRTEPATNNNEQTIS